VIVDDIGNQIESGRASIDLPGPVALAILPHTPFARMLAAEGRAHGKEILVHMPMQPTDADADPGPGALTLSDDARAIGAALAAALEAVPHATGVSNHMGSLLTRDPIAMREFMATLAQREELFFVDSYTTHLSIGLMTAREYGIPALKRDVFLDADPSVKGLEDAWTALLARAREQGFAVGIAHPHPQTLAVLERSIAALRDVELVTLGELLSGVSGQRSYAESIGSPPIADFTPSLGIH